MNESSATNASSNLQDAMDFLAKCQPELQSQYGGQWVAVEGRHVRMAAGDLVTLQRMVDANRTSDAIVLDYIPFPDELIEWK